jgi:rubrerythrin
MGETMGSKTEKNLAYAFAAESKAAARNETFARKAEAEGYGIIGRLFRAVSDAESVHARRYLMLMRGKIGTTEENLQAAFENEIKANAEEYPNLIKDASEEGEDAVLKAFSQSRDVESRHAELYKKAMNNLLAERETLYFVCQVCGYVSEDEAPDNCPVCGAVKGKFKKVD